MVKECIICSKEFEGRNNLQKCCSKECSKINNKKTRLDYINSNNYKEAKIKYNHSEKCKITKNIYSKSEKNKEALRNYHKSDKYKKYNEKYREKDNFKHWLKNYLESEHYKELHKKYIEAQSYKEYKKRYQQSEEFKKSRIKYRQSEKGKQEKRKRRACKNHIIELFTSQEWSQMKEATKGICPGCNRDVGISNITLDHIYSVFHANNDFLKNGIKRIYNINDIQPLCKSCNSSKRDKLDWKKE